jgi:hypothetical protein
MTETTIRVFWAALTANWPTAMSGPVSVLFVIAAFLFRMKQQDTDLRICGCRSHLPRRCIYWIWSAGRTRGDALEKKTAVLESMRPELELIFNDRTHFAFVMSTTIGLTEGRSKLVTGHSSRHTLRSCGRI